MFSPRGSGRRARRARLLFALVLALLARAAGQTADGTTPAADDATVLCSLENLLECDDRCTLDGARANPCPRAEDGIYDLECRNHPNVNVLDIQCYNRCDEFVEIEGTSEFVAYSTSVALERNAFDATCADRLASLAATNAVADSFASPLRAPPGVTAGLSTVPFSMFRNGPLHTGRSDHAGPESNPRVGWTFPTGGRVFSSPTLASDGTVYVGCTDGFVYGIQRSGVIKWRYPAGGPVVGTAAIGNPIGSDTTMFVGGADGELHAVSANYGTSKWSYIRPRLHLNGRWQMRAKRPIVSSAALSPEGIVYVGADTALVALNAATGSGGFAGTVKWSYETRGLVLASPALDDLGRIYVGSMDGSMYALVRENGAYLWRFDAEGGLYSSPALDGRGRLYVGSVDGYLYALDAATGALAWKFRTSAAVYSSPATSWATANDDQVEQQQQSQGSSSTGSATDRSGELVYVGSTDWKLYAVRAEDGTLAWNQTLRHPNGTQHGGGTNDASNDASSDASNDSASAAASAPYVPATLRAKREAEAILEAEGVCPPNLEQGASEETSFRFGWNIRLECARDEGAVGVVASPVLSPNGLVYVGSGDGYFYAVRNLTGKVAWTMRADGAVQSSAAVDESGRLYFATDNGTVYQIVEDAGSSSAS